MTALALLLFCLAPSPTPGNLNHAEGEVQHLSTTIETRQGYAEVLLAPGVFLRLDNNSAVALDPSLHLTKGRALIEALYVPKPADIGLGVTLIASGLYLLDRDRNSIAVYQGKARVGSVTVKTGQQLMVTSKQISSFNRKEISELYTWSKLRSQVLAFATRDAAKPIIDGRRSWIGAGWYLNDGFQEYVFLPSDGELRSPFGFWFVSPWVEYAPLRPMFS